ncbi:NAD-dependent protein deacetylase [Arhodomonas sp. SL1]|uniref:NAD-dependent protein deacetylase n=1 Tax=Arhodomonas sp. SL1 TaxID=3425691 RepID=UPI003F884BC1
MSAATALRTRFPAAARMPPPAREGGSGELAGLLRSGRAVVLTGAGCSTGSGIPDYRDAGGRWKGRQPMQYQQFLRSAAGRRRYWARSLLGWPRVAAATPNAGHRALASLEAYGAVTGVITQNVDGLHGRAGSRVVVDLHGRLDRVECLDCGAMGERDAFQERLWIANPQWGRLAAGDAPDGDADLDGVDYDRFRVPGCGRCGGVLKPAVVFFGEGVPRPRVDRAMGLMQAADTLLVAGSSLMVWSGYRFVRAARERGMRVVAVGLGLTRGEAELDFRVTDDCATVLAGLADALPA